MAIAKIIHASHTVSVTDLRRDPSGILESAGDMPIAVLNHNRPTAYLLSAKAYETLLEKLDDVSLINLVKSRRGGKTVKVKLEDL
jgi:antitoxin StbD